MRITLHLLSLTGLLALITGCRGPSDPPLAAYISVAKDTLKAKVAKGQVVRAGDSFVVKVPGGTSETVTVNYARLYWERGERKFEVRVLCRGVEKTVRL